MKFEREEDIQDWLIDIIKEKGWTVEREVPTDETKRKKYPEKIDLLIFKSKYPKLDPIGIELKYIRGQSKGTIISKAMDQLLFKYVRGHFKGLKIKTLCIGIYYNKERDDDARNNIILNNHIFTRGLLNYWGIGYLNLNDNHLRIFFGAENMIDLIIYLSYIYDYPPYSEENEKRYKVNEDKIIKNSLKWQKFLK